jgi:hypothetical protein
MICIASFIKSSTVASHTSSIIALPRAGEKDEAVDDDPDKSVVNDEYKKQFT